MAQAFTGGGPALSAIAGRGKAELDRSSVRLVPLLAIVANGTLVGWARLQAVAFSIDIEAPVFCASATTVNSSWTGLTVHVEVRPAHGNEKSTEIDVTARPVWRTV